MVTLKLYHTHVIRGCVIEPRNSTKIRVFVYKQGRSNIIKLISFQIISFITTLIIAQYSMLSQGNNLVLFKSFMFFIINICMKHLYYTSTQWHDVPWVSVFSSITEHRIPTPCKRRYPFIFNPICYAVAVRSTCICPNIIVFCCHILYFLIFIPSILYGWTKGSALLYLFILVRLPFKCHDFLNNLSVTESNPPDIKLYHLPLYISFFISCTFYLISALH